MRPSKRKAAWIALGVIASAASAAVYLYSAPGYLGCSAEARPTLPRIAHAGGGYDAHTYTDSLQALDANRDHFDLFEIDFNTTLDDRIVCIHDWEESAMRSFGRQLSPPPSLAAFNRLNLENAKYTHCTLETLMAWLKQNPRKRVVTDAKDRNLFVLSEIARLYPEQRNRFIPQIYDPSEREPVRALGFDDVIFTTYRYEKGNSDILRHALDMRPYALTMPADKARKLAPRAQCLGIPTYAHTVNDPDDLRKLNRQGVDEIYTDWLKAY